MILFDLMLAILTSAIAIFMFKEAYVRTGFLKLYAFCNGILCVILTLSVIYPDSIRYLSDKIIQILSYKVW